MVKSSKASVKPKAKAAANNPGDGTAVAAPKAAKDSKEKTIKPKIRGPFVVGAREEEYEIIQRDTHSCGGGFEIEMEVVRKASETSGPLDVLKTLCNECGAHVDFHFDISSFYDSEEAEFDAESPKDEAPEGEDDEGGWLS